MVHFKELYFQKVISTEAFGPIFRFNLSYRDVVELLQDRGITHGHALGSSLWSYF